MWVTDETDLSPSILMLKGIYITSVQSHTKFKPRKSKLTLASFLAVAADINNAYECILWNSNKKNLNIIWVTKETRVADRKCNEEIYAFT